MKFRLCTQAVAEGKFADEIIPIEVRGVVVSEDDTVRPGVTLEGLAALKPSFPNWGNSITTAGNASGVGDGAAICILTTRYEANRRGLEIIGKYVTSAVVGQLVAAASLVFYSRVCKVSSLGIWASHQFMPYPRLLHWLGCQKTMLMSTKYAVLDVSFGSLNDSCFVDQRSLCISVRSLREPAGNPDDENQS